MLSVFLVGTTWDKDFRICLVLSSLKVDDNNFDKNSEFYVAEDKVSVIILKNYSILFSPQHGHKQFKLFISVSIYR